MERSNLKRNKGFSLLELIIMVAILSISITGVMQAFSYSARIAGLCSDITRAVFIAEDKMQELEFKERTDSLAQGAPVASGENGKFSWGYSLAPDEALKLYRLDFLLTWERLGRKEEIALNTYLKK